MTGSSSPGPIHGPSSDYYLWSDTDLKYPDIRIIFTDTRESNWAFDSVRRQFYFHRLFSHQPDLNFENPAVHEAIHEIVRHWLDLGVDGFRLDAIPYLYESEDGNGEGEPPTHEFVRKLLVVDHAPDLVLPEIAAGGRARASVVKDDGHSLVGGLGRVPPKPRRTHPGDGERGIPPG